MRNSYRGNGADFYINERITWTNQGNGNVMDVDTQFQIVVAGNGDVKLFLDDPASCRVR